jgi:hypothetical protein
MSVLRGEQPDKVPFTVYDIMLPRCSVERELRNRGLCLVKLSFSYKIIYPNVDIQSIHFKSDSGKALIRTEYKTPVGDLWTLSENTGHANDWPLEFMFKSPDDYKKLLYIINDAVIVPEYDNVEKMVNTLGEDYIVRDQIGLEPMQTLISSDYMGVNNFCMEWMENRDEILKLYSALNEMRRRIYGIVANGPLDLSNYGGNVVPQIIGPEVFRQYYIPAYNEAAEILHKRKKLIGCHFDADNTLIMDDIAKSELDYIEAYDAGMGPSIGEARSKWPDKVLWVNWPSSWHLKEEDEIPGLTGRLIKETGSQDKFIIGITEDVPEERWQTNFSLIMNGIDSHMK